MPLSFLPSYLRTLLEGEANSTDEECDLQEAIDEQSDWVLVDYRSEASKRKQSDDDLLQGYIVIEGQENGRKEDDSWLDVGAMVTRGSGHNSSRKAARRARERAKRGERQSSCLGIPCKFTKLPVNRLTPRWRITDDVPTVKVDPSKERLSSSIPFIKPYETQMDERIVPFHGKDQVRSLDVLRVLQDLSKKTSSAIIYCDFAQLNSLNVCTTRDLVCVENWHQTCAMNSRDKYMLSQFMTHNNDTFSDIMTRDQCMCPNTVARDTGMFSRMLTMDMPILKNKLVLPFREAVENDDEDVFDDCIDSTSQIFSLSTTSESFYSKFYTTKKKFQDLLKSLLLLHLLVGKKLQSWKNNTMSNIIQLATGDVIPVATTTPLYNVTKSSAAVSEKLRGHAYGGHVTGKQLRRQNRTTMKKNVVNSNRQRGMKCGRFQNNVGRRESWH